jgi:hypothetical protein
VKENNHIKALGKESIPKRTQKTSRTNRNFGLYWVMPSRVIDLFACWWSGGRSRSAVVWKMAPCCLMWCLWTERNDRQFEDKERTIEELISFFLHSLYSWTAAYLAPLEISYNDFLVLLSSSSS